MMLNRYFAFGLAAFLLTSCVKDEVLHPFAIPDLVQSYIRKVECFDQYKTIFVASDGGILLKYADDEQVMFDASGYPVINDIQWPNAQVLYSPANEIFWVISDSIYLKAGRTRLETFMDKTPFFAPTKAYKSFVVTPEGDLLRIGFFKEEWNPENGFESEYFIGIYKFLSNENNPWEEYETNMTITSSFLSAPAAVFNENETLVLLTNPQYMLANYDQDYPEYEVIGKVGSGFNYKTMVLPAVGPNGTIYGLDRVPSNISPVTHALSTLESSNLVERYEMQTLCAIEEENQGAVKLLGWAGHTLQVFYQNFTNANSLDNTYLGYIWQYDLNSGACNINYLRSDEKLRFSEPIRDVDLFDGKVYLGTRNGLLIYDLATNEISTYISTLFDEFKNVE